jgi:hypothetical protein
LALCQRYFNSSYDDGVKPGTNTGNGYQISWASSASGSIAGGGLSFPVKMRSTPTITVYDRSGNSGVVTGFNQDAVATDSITINTTEKSTTWLWVRIYAESYYGIGYNYTASAEL